MIPQGIKRVPKAQTGCQGSTKVGKNSSETSGNRGCFTEEEWMKYGRVEVWNKCCSALQGGQQICGFVYITSFHASCIQLQRRLATSRVEAGFKCRTAVPATLRPDCCGVISYSAMVRDKRGWGFPSVYEVESVIVQQYHHVFYRRLWFACTYANRPQDMDNTER